MANTDILGLNENELFENLRASSSEVGPRARDVLAIKDDVLYTWDFRDNCLRTLNVKAAREDGAEACRPQSLVTTNPPLFSPTSLVANESGTLVAVAAATGVLVVEVPSRAPPYGRFEGNKEVIYCRSHSLLERLAFNTSVEVRQVKFHAGSVRDAHVLVLTSNNVLRVFEIGGDGGFECLGAHSIGVQPMGCFPNTRTSYLEALGDTAVDFDFGPVEPRRAKPKGPGRGGDFESTVAEFNRMRVSAEDRSQVEFPIYVLYKNGDVYVVFVELKPKCPATIKGPLGVFPKNQELYGEDSCSILCLQTTPTIVCIANNKGTIYHGLVLDSDGDVDEFPFEHEDRPKFIEPPDRSINIFESVELQLGLSTTSKDYHYNCPVFLHKNQAKSGHYFATHEAGVHSININCVEGLNKFFDGEEEIENREIFESTSTAEYLLCTKIDQIENLNPVIGFSVYFDLPSIAILLSNGVFVSLGLAKLFRIDVINENGWNSGEINSPMKKILSEPFDLKIQKILQQSSTQPIIKTLSKKNYTRQQCYDLLQTVSQALRDRFRSHVEAKDEIERRLRTLTKIKELQKSDLTELRKHQTLLTEKAGELAEKYEDIKDKQDEIARRCERILVTISRKRPEPSEAEIAFLNEVTAADSKKDTYATAVRRLREKVKYQEVQMRSWRERREPRDVRNAQIDAVKANLRDMNAKITGMVAEVNQHKRRLGLK